MKPAGLQVYELSGGPGCGRRMVLYPLPVEAVHLLEFPSPGQPGVREVWAYQDGNRQAEPPVRMMDAVCFTGHRGCVKGQPEKKEEES